MEMVIFDGVQRCRGSIEVVVVALLLVYIALSVVDGVLSRVGKDASLCWRVQSKSRSHAPFSTDKKNTFWLNVFLL